MDKSLDDLVAESRHGKRGRDDDRRRRDDGSWDRGGGSGGGRDRRGSWQSGSGNGGGDRRGSWQGDSGGGGGDRRSSWQGGSGGSGGGGADRRGSWQGSNGGGGGDRRSSWQGGSGDDSGGVWQRLGGGGGGSHKRARSDGDPENRGERIDQEGYLWFDPESGVCTYYQDRRRKWPFTTGVAGKEHLTALVKANTALRQRNSTLLEAAGEPGRIAAEGERLYVEKPTLRGEANVTWSFDEYGHPGLQLFCELKPTAEFVPDNSSSMRPNHARSVSPPQIPRTCPTLCLRWSAHPPSRQT